MKKLLMVSFVICLISFPLFSDASIKFKEKSINFGDLDENKFANLKFEFENTGDSVLVLKKVLASCGCTTVGVKKKEFKPGEKGSIPVKFNPKGYHGRVTKVVTVHTNDPSNASVRLMLSGNIILKNYSEPVVPKTEIDFGEVEIGKEYKKKVEIKNIGTINLDFEEVFHVPVIIPYFSDVSIKPKTTGNIEIIFRPSKPGRFLKFLRVRTNSYKKRLIMIKISAIVK